MGGGEAVDPVPGRVFEDRIPIQEVLFGRPCGFDCGVLVLTAFLVVSQFGFSSSRDASRNIVCFFC